MLLWNHDFTQGGPPSPHRRAALSFPVLTGVIIEAWRSRRQVGGRRRTRIARRPGREGSGPDWPDAGEEDRGDDESGARARRDAVPQHRGTVLSLRMTVPGPG